MAEYQIVTTPSLGPPPDGRALWTVAQVEKRVRLVIADGGPKDGWVYDLDHMKMSDPDRAPVESVTYGDTGILGQLDDGRIVRVFAMTPREKE